MNARAAFCVDSLMADQHAATLSADQARGERAVDVEQEIDEAMVNALCRGQRAPVPAAAIADLAFDDRETEKDAFDVLFDHLGDDKAKPLLLALLRTNSPEALALVRYAAQRHAHFNANDINNIRDRVAMEQ